MFVIVIYSKQGTCKGSYFSERDEYGLVDFPLRCVNGSKVKQSESSDGQNGCDK